MISDYWANKLLDALTADVTHPTTVYVALLQAIPIRQTPTPGSECSAGNYVRVAVTLGAAADQKKKNTAAVTFLAPNADWAPAATPVIAVALMDSGPSGGQANWLFATPICPYIIKNGDPAPTFAIGGLLAAFSSCFP